MSDKSSGRRGADGAALGKKTNNCAAHGREPKNGTRAIRRSAIWDQRRKLWEVSSLDRVKRCGRFVIDEHAAVNKRPDGRAGYGGLRVCGSVWACPSCASKILARRADELLTAIDAWHELGGYLALVTLTMRHHRGDRLAELWEAMSPAFHRAHTNRAARKLKDVAGWEGFVRNVEANFGRANGWHLHTHALVFIRSPEHAQALGNAMFDGWAAKLTAQGMATPLRDSGGLDVKVMDLAQAREHVASYLTKSHGESAKTAALELAGPTTKTAGGSNRTTWQVLADITSGDGDAEDLAVWREWEQASSGKRQMTWSRNGLRERLVPDVELTDDEIAEQEDESARVVALIGWQDWRRVIRCGNLAELILDAAERHDDDERAFMAVSNVMWLYGAGKPIRPPDDRQSPDALGVEAEFARA